MVMTQLALVFLGVLALVPTLLAFSNMDDKTRALLAFIASIIWIIFGFSAWDVQTVASGVATRSDPILPLVWVGIGLGIAIGLMALYLLVAAGGREVGATNAEGFLND